MRDVIVIDQRKNLGFIDIAGVGFGMKNPVGVLGKRLSVPLLVLLFSTNAILAEAGKGGKTAFFFPGKFVSQTSKQRAAFLHFLSDDFVVAFIYDEFFSVAKKRVPASCFFHNSHWGGIFFVNSHESRREKEKMGSSQLAGFATD
jgi:hypothetical protein